MESPKVVPIPRRRPRDFFSNEREAKSLPLRAKTYYARYLPKKSEVPLGGFTVQVNPSGRRTWRVQKRVAGGRNVTVNLGAVGEVRLEDGNRPANTSSVASRSR